MCSWLFRGSSSRVALLKVVVCTILRFIFIPSLCGGNKKPARGSKKARRYMSDQLESIMPWHSVCPHGNRGGNRKAHSQVQRKRARNACSGIEEPPSIKPVFPETGHRQGKRARRERHVVSRSLHRADVRVQGRDARVQRRHKDLIEIYYRGQRESREPMQVRDHKTKIVGTIGPASESSEMLEQ
jgi:hypothetical protein